MIKYILLFCITGLSAVSDRDVQISGGYDPVCMQELHVAETKISVQVSEIVRLQSDLQNSKRYGFELEIKNRDLRREINELRIELLDREEQLSDALRYKVLGFILLALLLIYVAWWCLPYIVKMMKMIIGAVGAMVRFILTLPRKLVSWFQAHIGNYEDIDEIELSPMVNEAILPNSPLREVVRFDQCIFKVFLVDSEFSDKLHFNGLGFWSNAGETVENVSGVFLTARHVLPSSGEIVLKSANDETKMYRMSVDEWDEFEDYDLAYYQPPQRITTTLGLRKAKVPKAILKDCVVVNAFGRNKTSMGPLKPIERSIYQNFDGSTVNGFSGSPYMAGKTAFGIHIGSSKTNGMGIDLAFVNMKLAHKKFTRESSEDWLFDQIQLAWDRGTELDWNRYGLDDVVINVKGRDIFFDYGVFQEVLFDAEEDYGKRKGKKRRNRDYNPESFVDIEGLPKNCLAPTPVLVTGATVVTDVQSQQSPKLSKLHSLPKAELKSTAGQTSTDAQSSEALQIMLESMKNLTEQMRSLTLKQEKLSARVFGAVAKKRGPPTPPMVKKE